MSTKQPRKSDIGWNYEVTPPHEEASYKFWQVGGPGMDGGCFCESEEDANMVAAALNFATNYDKVARHAKTLTDELQYLLEFKPKEKK